MARFGDNPIYSDPPGDLRIPCEDLTTDDDYCLTPDILTTFAQENMPLATGSENGLISGANADKLTALYTKAELDALFAQTAQFPFPIFIASPSDGFIEVFQNVLDNDVVWDAAAFALSSGTGYLTVKIDGTPITGWDNLHLTSTPGSATATAAKTLAPGSVLGLEFSAGATPVNLRLTLKGDVTLT